MNKQKMPTKTSETLLCQRQKKKPFFFLLLPNRSRKAFRKWAKVFICINKKEKIYEWNFIRIAGFFFVRLIMLMNSLIMCISNICIKSLIRYICGLATIIDEESSSLLGFSFRFTNAVASTWALIMTPFLTIGQSSIP